MKEKLQKKETTYLIVAEKEDYVVESYNESRKKKRKKEGRKWKSERKSEEESTDW